MNSIKLTAKKKLYDPTKYVRGEVLIKKPELDKDKGVYCYKDFVERQRNSTVVPNTTEKKSWGNNENQGGGEVNYGRSSMGSNNNKTQIKEVNKFEIDKSVHNPYEMIDLLPMGGNNNQFMGNNTNIGMSNMYSMSNTNNQYSVNNLNNNMMNMSNMNNMNQFGINNNTNVNPSYLQSGINMNQQQVIGQNQFSNNNIGSSYNLMNYTNIQGQGGNNVSQSQNNFNEFQNQFSQVNLNNNNVQSMVNNNNMQINQSTMNTKFPNQSDLYSYSNYPKK